jgi:hypothetical protein
MLNGTVVRLFGCAGLSLQGFDLVCEAQSGMNDVAN